MKCVHVLTPAILLCCGIFGCGLADPGIPGSGKVITETRDVSAFTSVELLVPVNLDIRHGDTTSLELAIDDNLMSLVKTTVTEGTLKIEPEKNVTPSSGCRITIVAPTISALEVAGASTVTLETLSGPAAKLSIAGASELTGGVDAESLECEIAGAGKLNLSGSAQKVSVSIAGSGDVQMQKIAAENVSVEIAGSGSVQVHAEKTLEVSIAGSGDVVYSGNPEIRKSIAGSGSIREMPTLPSQNPVPAETQPPQPPASKNSDKTSDTQ